MNELPEDLERAFRTLDAQAAMRAERVDPERVAERVLERLRTEARIEVLLPLPPAATKTDEALSPTQRARAVGR